MQVLTQVDKAEEGDRWARNVNIVGLSMGGMIAQEVVLMDPSRFGSLTLIATHAGGIVGTLPPPHGALPLMQTFGGLGGPGALDAGLLLEIVQIVMKVINLPVRHGAVIPGGTSEGTNLSASLGRTCS